MTTKTWETHEPALRAQAAKHLIFKLGDEYYGLPVLQVREIIRLVEITPIPRMPAFIRGVINLRGRIIPVLDLRLRFDLAAAEATQTTCIIVAQINSPSGGNSLMGLRVDGVEEVLSLSPGDIEETPDFGTQLKFVSGIAKAKGKVVALLDIDRVPATDADEKALETNAP
jgi:purine-binding chemotaxis protein CheW